MKKIFYSLLLGISFNANAQIHQVSSFSTGEIEYSSSILDNDNNVVGYTFIYNKGLKGDKVNYEYVILDKNLNKLTNGDIEYPFHKKIDYKLHQSSFVGNDLVLNFRVINSSKSKYVGFINTVVDAKTKSVKSSKFINKFISEPIPDAKALTKKKYPFDDVEYERMRTSHAQSTFYTTYAKAYMYDAFAMKTSDFGVYDQNLNLLYKREQGKEGLTGQRFFDITDFRDKQMVASSLYIKMKGLKTVAEVDSLYVRNLDQKKWDLKINHNTNIEKGLPLNVSAKLMDDKLAVVTPLHTATLAVKGIRRTIYDTKGKKELDNYVMFEEVLNSLGFGSKKFGDGYKLEVTEVVNFKDFSFLVLLEKNKIPKVQFGGISKKTEDYILLYFDEKGQFKKHFVLEKSASKKGYDSYLFAQSDLENKEVIFYYEDLDLGLLKIKKRDLVINKFIDGEFTEERIPYQTDESDLRFSNAKFGHIMITEFNNKEEAVSIRLERVNL